MEQQIGSRKFVRIGGSDERREPCRAKEDPIKNELTQLYQRLNEINRDPRIFGKDKSQIDPTVYRDFLNLKNPLKDRITVLKWMQQTQRQI
jgi:hypothetical protein